MASFIKKYPLFLLLTLTAFVTVTELLLHTYYGYYSTSTVLIILCMGLLAVIRYILVSICVIMTVLSIVKRQPKVLFILLWIFMAIIGQIPKEHFKTMGALLSLYSNDPVQVHNEARTLMDEYAPMTCIGYQNQRFPCDNPISRDRLPPLIQRMHIRSVLIFENYVLIEKFGLEGVFRGFVIFREGFDLWINEKPVTRNGCNTCWKIRIIDGLYWYHADPSNPPVLVSPLK